MVECKECGKTFPSDRSLHAHLKSHKLKVKDYYHKHFPRRDKYDNELIKFTNKESYFATDFNNKNNLKVGDLLKFGVSHPCITIDSWNTLYMINNKNGKKYEMMLKEVQ